MTKRIKHISCNTIVCDIGATDIKAGFAFDDAPQRFTGMSLESVLKCILAKPLSVNNGQQIESTNLILCVDEKNDFCFEKYNFQKIAICSSPPLIMAARGATSALVVDCGASGTRITPVCEGYVQKNQIKRLEIGGNAVSSHLMDLMKRTDFVNAFLKDINVAERIKREFSFVSTNLLEDTYISEKTFWYEKKIQLPDGTLVLNEERFLASEILFQPKLLSPSSEQRGVTELISESIESCALDLRAGLYKNILLSGGSTSLPGFAQRIRKDLLCVPDHDPDPETLVFRGGCVLAKLDEDEFWNLKFSQKY